MKSECLNVVWLKGILARHTKRGQNHVTAQKNNMKLG